MLNLSLKQQYFDAVKAGLKTVEGRLNRPRFKYLQPGMKISFTATNTHEVIECTIVELIIYPSFEAMLTSAGLKNMLPEICTIAEGIALYESFPGYKEEVEKFGVLAIRLHVSKNPQLTINKK